MGSFLAKAAGGIIGGLASIYNSAQQRKTSRYNTDRTIQANKNMAEYKYSKDLEMYNRRNQYDTPKAQRQRLKDAGLNPNLVYGTGTVTGNTSGASPEYQAPRADYNYSPMQLPGEISTYQDMAMKSAQVDNVKAQTQNTNQQTDNEAIKGLILGTQNASSKFKLNMAKYLEQYTYNKAYSEMMRARENAYNAKLYGKKIEADTGFSIGKTKAKAFGGSLPVNIFNMATDKVQDFKDWWFGMQKPDKDVKWRH